MLLSSASLIGTSVFIVCCFSLCERQRIDASEFRIAERNVSWVGTARRYGVVVMIHIVDSPALIVRGAARSASPAPVRLRRRSVRLPCSTSRATAWPWAVGHWRQVPQAVPFDQKTC